MGNELLISLGSLFTAFFSVLLAFRSNRIAQRALLIAESEFNSRKEKLKVYLVEGFSYITSEGNYVFGFNVSITNQALAANTIQRIELMITFVRGDGTTGNLILQHCPSLYSAIQGHEVTPFETPCGMEEKSAITKWCLFLFDPTFSQFGRIDKYTLRISDTIGEISEVDSYLIKEYRIA